MLFVCYPKCTTCQKAKAWLEGRGLDFDVRDIKTDRPTEAELRQWHERSGLPLKRFFNTSGLQYKALADVCEKMLKDAGEPPHHVEGHRGGTWILLDFSSVVVHIFNEEAREFYDLERLWSDATPVDLTGVLTEN